MTDIVERLSDAELQSLRNIGNESERAAGEIERLRAEVERLRLPALRMEHEAERAARFEVECVDLRAEVASANETMQFVERWANHHAAKPTCSAEAALSCIQHYPPIVAITRSYADGKVPDTPNPWAEVAALRALIKSMAAALRALIKSMGNGYDDEAIDAALAKERQP